MKQIVTARLKKFFKLDEEEYLMSLDNDNKIRTITGLSTLIHSLNDATLSPKEIAIQIEDVIVCIAIKNKKATELEHSLKHLLENIQEQLETGEIEFQDNSEKR